MSRPWQVVVIRLRVGSRSSVGMSVSHDWRGGRLGKRNSLGLSARHVEKCLPEVRAHATRAETNAACSCHFPRMLRGRRACYAGGEVSAPNAACSFQYPRTKSLHVPRWRHTTRAQRFRCQSKHIIITFRNRNSSTNSMPRQLDTPLWF